MSRNFNEDRQAAIRFNLKTYTGSPHSKCGTSERYVAGGSCVHCARLLASEQREALKFLRANSGTGPGQTTVDNRSPDEVEKEEAAERARRSVDELM